MTKILKPYTIIPSNLYVNRDADRQLRHIIKDMERPGYVLVSRQMGKTNLLLNAKRELESNEDIFIYIDLSGTFENSKDCFENIINTILDANSAKLSKVQNMIFKARKESPNIPYHKQHISELRAILNSIKGKLVIILDEIDSLTNTLYSDQIFAQIRSIYFIRINFPELNKLTYILSGVIEPNDIIQDPKISPFNIGQKIFLNDFSHAEFEDFIKKAQLSINEKIKERIYYWTNGNPRITWDVCSEVENEIRKKQLSIEDIDNIIYSLYLKEFDKPPIDNIREIVKADKVIRNAIVEIEYNKGNEISDNTKNKLYLAGIINFEDKSIQIKNNIIRHSLNLKWIKSLEREEKSLIPLALDYFGQDKFDDCLSTFEQYLENSVFPEEEASSYYYLMGTAAYKMLNFEKSINYLDHCVVDLEDNRIMKLELENLRGLVYYYLKNYEKSLVSLKYVLDNSRQEQLFAKALVNYGSIALDSGDSKYKEESISTFERIIDGSFLDSGKLNPLLINELKSIASFNMSQLYIDSNEPIKAIKYLTSAIDLAKDEAKPVMILTHTSLLKDNEDKIKQLSILTQLLQEKRISPKKIDPDYPLNFDINQLNEILILSFILDKINLYDKLGPILKELYPNFTQSTLLYYLASYALKHNQFDNGIFILLSIVTNKESYKIPDDIYLNSLKTLALYSDTKISLSKPTEFIRALKTQKTPKLDLNDLQIFVNLINGYIQRKKFNDALLYVKIFKSLKKYLNEIDKDNSIIIDQLELTIYINKKEQKNIVRKSLEILEISKNIKVEHLDKSIFGETGFDIIKQNAQYLAYGSKTKKQPIRRELKIKRNDIVTVKYRNGSVKQAKYKLVENDISNGLCVMLNQ